MTMCVSKPHPSLSWMEPRELPLLALSLFCAPLHCLSSHLLLWLGNLLPSAVLHWEPSQQSLWVWCHTVSESCSLPLVSVNSSRTILDANEEFKSMSGTIQLGRKLITKYNRRELTDKILIFLALALFLATVLYILKKRLFPFL